MRNTSMVLGIDLGTSGVRIAVVALNNDLIHTEGMEYAQGLEHSEDWKTCCTSLIKKLPLSIRECLVACSVDGTSGTLVPCDQKGNPLGAALPYHLICPEQKEVISKLMLNNEAAGSINSSLARALRLIEEYGPEILLRHQADWINGWIINNWDWGEEGNNLRLGWDLTKKSWPQSFKNLPWRKALPNIIPSGNVISRIDESQAQNLGLPKDMLVVAGTTDANAAVLAANPKDEDGITVLGSTIVVKRFVRKPLQAKGVSNHLVGGRWLTGGSSNAGCAVLKQLFSDIDLSELSRQINPELDSGLKLLPLPFDGERFPVDDPTLKPILEPRPVSDALYLHGLLEGLSLIEAQCWKKLTSIGAKPPERIITLGGGAQNPQWRRLRERAIGIPIRTCKTPPALGVALLAIKAVTKKEVQFERRNQEIK